jgi:hypothetical protein
VSVVPNQLAGVVHGRTIELDRAPGLPDGQPVTVTLVPLATDAPLPAGEGLRRAFGTWDDDVEGLDQFLEETRRGRKRNRRGAGP